MRENLRKMILIGTFVLMLFGLAAFAFSPVQAYNAMQITPMPTSDVGGPVSTGIPQTGADATAPAGLSWVIWAILGISVIALLVALATRSVNRTDV